MEEDLGGATESTTTSREQLAFTPEALEALRRDLAYLQQLLVGQEGIGEQALNVLTGTSPLAQSAFAQPTRQAAAAGRLATANAGRQRGLSPRSTALVDATLQSQEPALLAPVAGLARGVGTNINSLIDPRLASFLRPDSVGSSSTTPSPLQTATALLGAGGTAASVFAG